jgi:hypothetical protein
LAQGPEEKCGLVGLVAGFARLNSAVVSVSVVVNVTLLAESSRRVGTAWPAAVSKDECGGGKAQRKIRVRLRNDPNAALHNKLKLHESASANRILNRSPR